MPWLIKEIDPYKFLNLTTQLVKRQKQFKRHFFLFEHQRLNFYSHHQDAENIYIHMGITFIKYQ